MKSRNIWEDERGVEPTVMKILVGIILVSLGLGIGVSLYQQFGEEIGDFGFELEFSDHPDGEVTMGTSETKNVLVETRAEFGIGEGEEEVTLNIRTIEGNLSASFVSDTIPVGGSTNLTIETDNTPVGQYIIEIEGLADGEIEDASIEVNVE